MKSPPQHAADAWLAAEAGGKPFAAEGAWGSASGSITGPAATGKRRWLMGGSRPVGTPTIVLVVPNVAGLEDDEPRSALEDAMSAGLLRGGAHVARVRALALSASPMERAAGYVDAVHDALAAACALDPGAKVGFAGVGLAGAVAAAASGRRADLACLALVCAPSPDLLARKTPENEDDEMWETSLTLRLADSLTHVEPLAAIAKHRRPVLLVSGAVDDDVPASHMESWRTALGASGRGIDSVEVGFADSLLRWRQSDGALLEGGAQAHDELAAIVSKWAVRTLRAR